MSGGSPVGNALANSQQQTPMGGGSSPLNTSGGMSGGQTQMPSFATPNMQRYETNEPFSLAHGPFSSVNSTTQQDMMRGGSGMPFGQRLGQLGFGGQQMAVPGAFNPSTFMNYGRQQPELSDVVGHFGNMQYRPQQQQPLSFDDYYKAPQQRTQQAYRIGEKEAEYQRYRDNFGTPSGMQVAQPPPMQNPFQPIEPSYMQDPEYQGYETQARDLGRQMDEYMKKAPMYQQLQELQGKMSPFQQRHQQQEMQRMQRMQQMQAMQQRQFQQPMGLQALMGQFRGRPVPQPRMAMDMPQTNRPMETLPASFPQTFGREQRYANPSADYRSVNRAAPAPAPALAPAPAPAPAPASAYDYF